MKGTKLSVGLNSLSKTQHIWQVHEDEEHTLGCLKWLMLRQLASACVSSQCLPADYLVSGPAR